MGLAEAWHAFAVRTAWKMADAVSSTHGIEIRSISDVGDAENPELASRVAAAVRVIAEADPQRLEAVKKALSGILIYAYRFGSAGFYIKASRLCVLSPDYVRRENRPERIALTIVHEAKHGQIADLGISADQHRVERLCVSAEIAFAKRLSDPRTWVAQARERWLDVPEVYTERYGLEVEIQGLERWRGPRLLKWLMLRSKRRKLARITGRPVAAQGVDAPI